MKKHQCWNRTAVLILMWTRFFMAQNKVIHYRRRKSRNIALSRRLFYRCPNGVFRQDLPQSPVNSGYCLIDELQLRGIAAALRSPGVPDDLESVANVVIQFRDRA